MRAGLEIYRGMAMRDALSVAKTLGCAVEQGHRHGEVRISHPLLRRRINTHSERKDAAAELVFWLLEVVAVDDAVETLRRLAPRTLSAASTEILCEVLKVQSAVVR